VVFDGPESLRGQIVPVKITAAQTFNLFGEVVFVPEVANAGA
jgi:hypothetical protein